MPSWVARLLPKRVARDPGATAPDANEAAFAADETAGCWADAVTVAMPNAISAMVNKKVFITNQSFA
jgi:hypothetical protein